MHSPPTDSSGGPNDLVVEIIETLETCGLEDDAYQLHDYVDVDALEQLVSSSDGDITVQFTVEGIPLEVSLDGVDVIVETSPSASTNNDVRCGDGNVLESPRPLDVPRPRETASRWPSFASLTRTPLRAPRACGACGVGDGRGGLAPSEPTRISAVSPSVEPG